MPLVLAHRGANRRAPQNTLPAFNKAVELCADGIETDVHLSKDKKIVICHNYTVDNTSNGEGLIDDMTFDELRALDFGSYFSDEFKGVTLPTLTEVLEATKDMTVINVEIKAPKQKNDLIKMTIDELHRMNLADKTIVSCFDPECVREAKEYDNDLRVGLLYEDTDLGKEIMDYGVTKLCKELKCYSAHPKHILMTEELIKNLHDNNIAVNPWTVNNKEDIIKYTNWGCDALISDIPDYVLSVLKELK